MVHDMQTERHAYAEVLEHEVKQALRMLRTLPADQFERLSPGSGASARDLARGFATQMHRIHELVGGRRSSDAAREPHTRAGIMLELETAYLSTYLALDAMPPFRWSEVIPAPARLAPWRQARRGELLWLALRELARHVRCFSIHVGASGRGRPVHDIAPLESQPVGA